MSREPEARNITVSYMDAEPHRITVSTVRYQGECRYSPEYKFKVSGDGSTAVLQTITPDGESYPVLTTQDSRTVAADAVQELPFIDNVVLFTTD